MNKMITMIKQRHDWITVLDAVSNRTHSKTRNSADRNGFLERSVNIYLRHFTGFKEAGRPIQNVFCPTERCQKRNTPSLGISERIKYKTACLCYSSIGSAALCNISERLQLYSFSRCLRSSSNTHMLKLRRFNRKPMAFALCPASVLTSGTTSPRTLDTLLFSLPSKNKLKAFLFSENEPHCPSPQLSV